MCHKHHMEQHSEGERVYWDGQGIDPIPVVEALNEAYPDQTEMTAIILRSNRR